jgi:hypothetical protein
MEVVSTKVQTAYHHAEDVLPQVTGETVTPYINIKQ